MQTHNITHNTRDNFIKITYGYKVISSLNLITIKSGIAIETPSQPDNIKNLVPGFSILLGLDLKSIAIYTHQFFNRLGGTVWN